MPPKVVFHSEVEALDVEKSKSSKVYSPELYSEVELIEAEIQDKKQEIARVGNWLTITDLSHERWKEGSLAYVRLQDDLIILDCRLIMAQIEQRIKV